MKYHHDLSQYSDYKCTITGAGQTFVGLMDDSDFTLSFGNELSEKGALAGGGFAGLMQKALGKTGDMIANIQKSFTGVDNPAELTTAYTVRKINGWKNPEIKCSMTFLAGSKLTTPNTYAGFIQAVSQVNLPKVEAGVMSSNQISWSEYAGLMSAALTGSNVLTESCNAKLCSFSYGNISIPSGLWITGIDVTQKNVLASGGSPVMWKASFTLEYFMQISANQFAGFAKGTTGKKG